MLQSSWFRDKVRRKLPYDGITSLEELKKITKQLMMKKRLIKHLKTLYKSRNFKAQGLVG